jgi:hypothetical protein
MIWKLSLPRRIVELQRKRTQTAPHEPIGPTYSTAPPPVALLVCKDSRRSTLPFYPLSFGTQIRFNFSLDILYLDFEFDDSILNFFDSLSMNEISQVKSLAVAKKLASSSKTSTLSGLNF